MEIRNVHRHELYQALNLINGEYDGNIKFKRIDKIRNSRSGKPVYRVTLTVHDSHAPGSRTSASWTRNKRRVAAACWHVHGNFFDTLLELCPDAIIITGWSKVHCENGEIKGNWADWNAGTQISPRRMSECCNCN